MFCLILGFNAWTDFKEGCVYDWISILLFLSAVYETGWPWQSLYFWGSFLFLGLLWLWDKGEVYLGRGDYLVLVSVSLYAGWQLPLILINTSVLALIFMGLQRQSAIPLIPFLFLGTMITEVLV